MEDSGPYTRGGRPGGNGDLTDVPGVRVGHWSDEVGRTGCTVVLLPDEGAVTAVDVRGAAPGTRETDLLAIDATVPGVHAVLLTGGSAFGLAAADGVVRRLEERGVGLPTPAGPVPLVPTAVVFDLPTGSAQARPDADAGYTAARAAEAGAPCGTGRVGAGTGATVGKLAGPDGAAPGGTGTASWVLPGGATVGVLVVVNALGDVVDEDGRVLAGPGTVELLLGPEAPAPPGLGTNTTLVLVATDLGLTKAEARRLAVVAHDGLARAIRPVHTDYDGDTAFAASTGDRPVDDTTMLVLQAAVVELVAAAVRGAVSA